MKGKMLLGAALVLSMVLLISLFGCGKPAGPASQAKKLKIGFMNPITGPAAEKGRPMGDANLDAIEYVNKELGGANGIFIDTVSMDSQYDMKLVPTIMNSFLDQGVLMFGVASSTEMATAMVEANRAELPGLVAFSSPINYRPPKHVYGQLPDYGDDAIAFTQYFMKNLWKGSGKPKIALHLLANPTGYGARDAFRAKAETLGVEIVATEEHKATTTSEIESLTRIKAKNPDVLYISSTPAPTALVVKNAVELGMYPGKMVIASGHAGMTKALVDLGGADRVEGVYGVYPTVDWASNVPGLAKVKEYAQKNHEKDVNNMDYITSWAQSLIMVEALKTAVKNVGYDKLAKGDTEARRLMETQGIQKLKNYDVQGLHGPVGYTTGDNRLAKSVRVFQIKKGVVTPITDWIEAPVIEYEKFDWFGK